MQIEVDYTDDFDLVGLLARHFRGALSVEALMRMRRRELFFWYEIYERQVEEENIVNECLSANPKKPVPNPKKMKQLVAERIRKRKEEQKIGG